MLSIIRHVISLWLSKMRPAAYAESLGVNVGKSCRFFSLHPGAFGSEPYLVTIGDNVTITAGVRFVTHDGSVFLFREEEPDLDAIGPITIGDNSFIGINTVILPGVSIGCDCVIGAMSLVTKNIPAGTVAAGNPARVIMTTRELREKLQKRSCNTGQYNYSEKKSVLSVCDSRSDEYGRSWLTRD